MTAIQLHGRPIQSVFELLGADENAMTYALGWCMAQAPALLAELAGHLGGSQAGEGASILLQEHGGRHGVTDIEVRDPGRIAWIFEAKAGFDPPGADQLAKYAARLVSEDQAADKRLIILARSDRRDLWLQMRAPESVDGVPVQVISWAQIGDAVRRAYPSSDNTAKALLRQFTAFLDRVLGMQVVSSNQVYVVSLNQDTFGGGPTTFVEVVETFGRYFHPVGSGWPVNPPNYMAFRWQGRLQSIHHIDDYEIITDFAPHFPGITEGEIEPHFLYHLGPPIRPSREVRAGKIFRAARVYAHIDLLLTCDTISDAMLKTNERLAAASRG